MLARTLPAGTAYLNTGHSNLTARVLGAVRGLQGASIVALIHDTIPLDHPDWQREGTVDQFRRKLKRVSDKADLVIASSEAVAADVTRHLTAMGRCPPLITAPLGVPVAGADPGGLPPAPPDKPYFVTVGTIEPRKNHALLLDAWAQLGPDPPTLYLCGTRGWRNEAVFARLDTRPPGIVECPGLSDGAVAALVQGARALLFPSLAEGYGIPAFEALALGTPVVAAPLPVFRDLLGEWAVYRDPADPYLWAATIRDLAQAPRRPVTGFVPPQWDQHFKVVLKAT
jgi:glycosyltransferase involved in cell wall biosynthesis